jgi:hypothetical protein
MTLQLQVKKLEWLQLKPCKKPLLLQEFSQYQVHAGQPPTQPSPQCQLELKLVAHEYLGERPLLSKQ